MSILDVAAKVLTTYKADTSDMKAGLKDLAGAEKELAAQQLAAAEARNKQSDEWVDKLGKIQLAFSVVTGAVKVGFDGLKDYGHRLDLEATAGSISIDKLSKAAGGLKTNMELLEHAAVFSKSSFQLTEDQMGTVERAMWALEERGKSSTEVWGAVSTALTKGTTKALEGLIGPIEKSSAAFDLNGDVLSTYGARAIAVSSMLKQLSKVSGEVGEGQYDVADAVSLTSVRMENAMETIKQAMGKVVIALEPLVKLVATLAEVSAGLIDRIADGLNDISDFAGFLMHGNSADAQKIADRHHLDTNYSYDGKQQYAATGDRVSNWIAGGGSGVDMTAVLDAENYREVEYNRSHPSAPVKDYDPGYVQGNDENVELQVMKQLAELKKEEYEKQLKLTAEGLRASTERIKEYWKHQSEMFVEGMKESHLAQEGVDEASRQSGQTDFLKQSAHVGQYRLHDKFSGSDPDADAMQATIDKFNSKMNEQRYGDYRKGKTASFLEETFGKVGEFSLYKQAFDMLGGATTAALGAWIDGSMSAGAAFKKFIGEALKGLASQMLIEALKHTAYGIGSLAMYDYPGAALHFAAAGAFGVGALAAGIAAKEMGAGAPTAAAGSKGGGAAAPTAPNVSSSGPAAQTGGIVVVTDSFADDTARMKQLRAQRLVGSVIGKNNAVVYG